MSSLKLYKLDILSVINGFKTIVFILSFAIGLGLGSTYNRWYFLVSLISAILLSLSVWSIKLIDDIRDPNINV